jgi:hypothetical protein
MFTTEKARAKIGRAYPKPSLDHAGKEFRFTVLRN